MTTVEEIQRDLACPQCEYNLRGLHGAIVNCPECGHACDVAMMVAQRWTQPWFKAPGLTTIYQPTAWVVVIGFIGSVCLLSSPTYEARLVILLGMIGGWIFLMGRTWFVFASKEGVHLALLAHVIFAGYMAGAAPIMMAICVIIAGLVDDRMGSFPWLWLVVSLVLTPIGIILILMGQQGERYIAERCIRQHLNKPPTS